MNVGDSNFTQTFPRRRYFNSDSDRFPGSPELCGSSHDTECLSDLSAELQSHSAFRRDGIGITVAGQLPIFSASGEDHGIPFRAIDPQPLSCMEKSGKTNTYTSN